MAFTNNYRLERVYFEKLKSMIDVLKSFLESETDEKGRAIIENGIDTDGAILLLYRNLGEAWAELSDLIKKANDKIDDLNDKTDAYHDELNERIDEVNNYIMAIIRELTARIEAIEADLASMSRNIVLDLGRENDEYTLSYKGEAVTFDQISEWVEFPHNVIVRGSVNGEETSFYLRESDPDTASGLFEFYAVGLVNNLIHELTVTVLPDDSVNVATDIQHGYTAGTGITIDNWVISGLDLWAKKGTGNYANIFNLIDGSNVNSATGTASNAFGNGTVASGDASFTEGSGTLASGTYSHAEGQGSKAIGFGSHVEGGGNEANGLFSHVGGSGSNARGQFSFIHGVGCETMTPDERSVVFGLANYSGGNECLTYGRYCHTYNNSPTSEDTYLEVVGNGTGPSSRSDARVLDKYGNEYLSGYISPLGGVRLIAPNNNTYTITVDNNGQLVVTPV